jgi:peptide/nickel transport system permease protein
MGHYVYQRTLSAVVVLFGVSVLTFLLMRLIPGDPVQYMFATYQGEAPSPEQIAEVRRQLGLDQPLHIQYFKYVTAALRGDLGRSVFLKRPVTEVIFDNFWYTLELAMAGLVLALVLGFASGTVAAAKRGSWLDTVTMLISLVGLSMPFFWLAVLLVLLFAIKLQLFPATGQGTPMHLILPATAVGLTVAGSLARLVRSSMLEVLNQEYIVVARAKGLSGLTVLVSHALPNAMIPPLTLAGLQFGRLMGGAVVTETVFARKGLGTVLVEAVISHDLPLTQGILLFIAAVYVIVNFTIDLLYAVIDPRIRYG